MNDNSKHAPKRNGAELASDRTEMLRLLRRGMTQSQIAERLGVSRQQITYDYKIVLKQLAAERSTDANELVAQQLERLAAVKEAAWREWERSKGETVKRTEERRPPKAQATKGRNGGKLKRGSTTPDALALRLEHVRSTMTTETGAGDSRLLEIILECEREENKLLGLYPKQPLQIEASGVFAWEDLFTSREGAPNPIEARLSREESRMRDKGEEEADRPALPAPKDEGGDDGGGR